MADWTMNGDGQTYTPVGGGASAMNGTSVAGGGIVHTKGSWILLGVNGGESGFLSVEFHGALSWVTPGSPPLQVKMLADVGIDSGTTTVLIPDICVMTPSAFVGQSLSNVVSFPVHVPAGSSIYGRVQAANGPPVALGMSATLAACGWGSSSGCQSAESWGTASGSSTGTNVTPGSAPSWGSYTALTTTSTVRADWLVMSVGCPGSFPLAGATHKYLAEVAVGAPASEQTLFTFPISVNELGQVQQPYLPPVPVSIPVGSRVSVRLTTSTGGANLTFAASAIG